MDECPKGHLFEQTPKSHLEGHGCLECTGKRKKTLPEFIEQANKIHNNKYDYSLTVYVNGITKIQIICPISNHGMFEQRPADHINQKHGCPKCGGSMVKTYGEFVADAKDIHGDKYDYSKSKYVNGTTKLIIICPILGHGEFKQTPNAHIYSECGCPKCGGTMKGSTTEFVKAATLIHDGIYDYSKVQYENQRTRVIIICPDHGEFEQLAGSHQEDMDAWIVLENV